MNTINDTADTCFIVVTVQAQNATVQMGILVDTVSEVLDIAGADIEPPPRFGSNIDTAFILGMAKSKGTVKILLDIDKILSGSEMASLAAF
jgi:purine-binding chemotaxis protein CheW